MKNELSNAVKSEIEALEAARMIASQELFEAMAIGATQDVLDAIDRKHKPTYDALRKLRGTALPEDIADQLMPRD